MRRAALLEWGAKRAAANVARSDSGADNDADDGDDSYGVTAEAPLRRGRAADSTTAGPRTDSSTDIRKGDADDDSPVTR